MQTSSISIPAITDLDVFTQATILCVSLALLGRLFPATEVSFYLCELKRLAHCIRFASNDRRRAIIVRTSLEQVDFQLCYGSASGVREFLVLEPEWKKYADQKRTPSTTVLFDFGTYHRGNVQIYTGSVNVFEQR